MRVLFVPLLAGKPWNGATISTTSLGGSEASVAYTARALAKLSNVQVSVIAHGDDKGTAYEGVKYYNLEAVNKLVEVPWDAVVVSRWIDALSWPWRTNCKVFWTHDLRTYVGAINAHKVVTVSEYQRLNWGFPEDVCTVIGNGVDIGRLQPKPLEDRDQNKLIWTSNPDRGLWVACKIFQDIRKRWPDLTLHIYGRAAVYGWSNEQEFPFLPQAQYRENVFLHDSLPRHLLFRELQNSWAFFYPTWWPETYCMAALEAQALGTPVITSPYGALLETVKGGILQHDYCNAVSQLRNKRRWNKLSQAGIEFGLDQTWDKQAARWMEVLQ